MLPTFIILMYESCDKNFNQKVYFHFSLTPCIGLVLTLIDSPWYRKKRKKEDLLLSSGSDFEDKENEKAGNLCKSVRTNNWCC